jgi:hypothetical protein
MAHSTQPQTTTDRNTIDTIQGLMLAFVSLTTVYTVFFNWTVPGIAFVLFVWLVFAGGAVVLEGVNRVLG